MIEALDIFENDAFGAVTLSDRVSRMPHQPMRIGQLGLFETKGIRTTQLVITESNGVLSIIPYTERGGPAKQMNSGQRRAIRIDTGHFPLERTITPSEIQNIYADSDEQRLASVQEVVDDKAREMVPFHDVTLEYQRLGALKGYIMESDGVNIRENLYERFKVTPHTVYFDLDDQTTDVRLVCLEVLALIETGLGAAVYTGARALCGSEFFNKLISHAKVKEAYERWQLNGQQGEMLRNDPRFTGFFFGGILWETYRGSVGGVDFIAEDECQIFPIGVPGMYVTRLAPADMIEFVNTVGLPRYASIERLKHGQGVELRTESNPISVCTRPNATVKGSAASGP